MKLKKRNTAARVLSSRITSPETRINPDTQQRELMLSYADSRFNHCHNVTTKELFLFSAGTNEEGELPDGLDRLQHHKFVIHLDKLDRAIGLDIIPSRVYRSGVIPSSQKDVETVKLSWSLNGAVCRVTQRPAGVTATQLVALVAQFDKLADAGTPITETTRLGDVGRVISVSGDVVEVKLKSGKGRGNPVYDTEAELSEV